MGAALLWGLSTCNKCQHDGNEIIFLFLDAWKAAFISGNTDSMTPRAGEVWLLGTGARGCGEWEFTRGTPSVHSDDQERRPNKPEPHTSNEKVLFLSLRARISPKASLNVTNIPLCQGLPAQLLCSQGNGTWGLSNSTVVFLKWHLVYYNVTVRLWAIPIALSVISPGMLKGIFVMSQPVSQRNSHRSCYLPNLYVRGCKNESTAFFLCFSRQ